MSKLFFIRRFVIMCRNVAFRHNICTLHIIRFSRMKNTFNELRLYKTLILLFYSNKSSFNYYKKMVFNTRKHLYVKYNNKTMVGIYINFSL